jgi:hypothetical protein
MVEDTWTVEEDVRREEVEVDEGTTGLRLGRGTRLESPSACSLTAGGFLVCGVPLASSPPRARKVLVFPSPVDLVGEAQGAV